MKYARTLHAIELYDEAPLGNGLFRAEDANGTVRVHNGTKYLGYAHNHWNNRRGEKRCLVHFLRPDGTRFSKGQFKTMRGAERALLREATR